MKQPLIILSALLLCVAGANADEAEWWDSGAFQCALNHYAEHGSQGFHGKDAERHRPPDRVVDFTHMQADLSIDPIQGSVAGTVKHTFKAIGRPCSEVTINAGGDIKIESLKDDQGNDLAFTHRDVSLTISLNKDLPVDQSSQIQIRYSSHPKDGLNFVHATVGGKRIREAWTQGETTFTRYWIPIWDYPNDRFTSDVTTRVPADYRVIGNGKLVAESVEGKIRVRQFKMAQSHVAYLLSLCIGQFEEIKDLTGPVPLWFVVYPEDKANLPNSLRRTGEVVRVLSELSGHAYPYAKYSQTVASEYPIGGMENVSATTLRRNRVNYDSSAALVYDVTGLVAHEAAHQWFGNIVTCRDWAHIWLNEGFATYFTSLFFERTDGKAAGMRSLRGMNGWYFGETQKYIRPLVTYVMDKPGSMFDAHTYAKGAWVLHMLRHKMGDKLFFKGVAAYLKRYWEKVADTSDFRRVMENISGLNLEAFFAQWVYRAGHPKLTAKVKVQTRQDRIVIDLSQRTAKPFDMALVIRVTGRSGYRDWPVRFRQAHRSVEIPLKEAPRTIEFDPDGVLLKELKLEIRPLWLFAQVQHGSTAWARADAARELGKLTGRERVVSALMAASTNPKEPLLVSKAAVQSLGKLATPEACAALMTQIHVDNAKLRYAVFKALKKCTQGPVASALIQAIDSDASVHVRSAALEALGNFPSKGNRSLLVDRLTTRSWNALLANGAAQAIVQIGGQWAFKNLEKVVRNTEHPINRRLVTFKALKKLAKVSKKNKARILVTVRKMAADSDPFMIREALKILVVLGAAADLPILEAGIARLPGKWTHKVAHNWRRKLATPKESPKNPAVKGLEKRLKRIQKQIDRLNRKRNK